MQSAGFALVLLSFRATPTGFRVDCRGGYLAANLAAMRG